MTPEHPVQIIALGSPFGADRIAWSALESLERTGFADRFPPDTVHLQSCPSPAQLPAMILPDARLVILDALEGIEAGEVRRLSPEELEQGDCHAGSHGLTLMAVLPLIRELYGEKAEPLIIGIGMGEERAATLSGTAMESLLGELIDLVTNAGA